MSSTSITQGDSKAVGTEEKILDRNLEHQTVASSSITFNVEVIAVPKEPLLPTDPSSSQNQFSVEVNNANVEKTNSTAGNIADSREHQTDNLKQNDYNENNISPINTPEGFQGLYCKEDSFSSVHTNLSVNVDPTISRAEIRCTESTQKLSSKINAQFNEDEEAGTSDIKIDIANILENSIEVLKKYENPTELVQALVHNDSSSNSLHTDVLVNIECGPVRTRTNSIGSIGELMLKEKEKIEEEDSFVTIEACQKEKMTSTEVPTIFSLDNRTQNILVASSDYRNQPPPPYNEPPQYTQQAGYQGRLGQNPVYQQQTMNYVVVPQDASRAPPYRRTETDFDDLFFEKEIRHKFVKRVYFILALQLMFTFGFISLCIYEEKTKEFVLAHPELVMVAMIGLFVVMIPLVCYMSTRRIFPLNFIMLSLLTLFMAYMMAYMSCTYETNIVMLAMGTTAGVCTLLSILACQNWFDITGWGMMLFVALLITMGYGLIAMIIYAFTGSDVLYIIYSCLITVIMCLYLMYDTQMIMGGRRVELSPEEYIFGALTLYIDIMVIFQHLLFLMGRFCR